MNNVNNYVVNDIIMVVHPETKYTIPVKIESVNEDGSFFGNPEWGFKDITEPFEFTVKDIFKFEAD